MTEESAMGIENELHNINLNLIELTNALKELKGSMSSIYNTLDDLREQLAETFPK